MLKSIRIRPKWVGLHRLVSSLSDKQAQRAKLLFEERNRQLLALKTREIFPLIQDVRSSAKQHTLKQFQTEFGSIELLEEHEQPLQLFGRVSSVRKASKGLFFIDITQDECKVQLVVNMKKLSNQQNFDRLDLLRPGDSVTAVGCAWRTKAGELSLLASQVPRIISPNMQPPFDLDCGVEIKRKNRAAFLKSHKPARDILRARSVAISSLNNYLTSNNFTMVQTPILSSQVGGASATPFKTTDGLALRIAPELWLKRLIIGGFEKVYEVGSSFRNEGIDSTHNPEFTTCELYWAFAGLDDLKQLTKEVFVTVARAVKDVDPMFAEPCNSVIEAEWGEIDFISGIESATGEQLPLKFDVEELKAYAVRHGAASSGDSAKILDHLAAKFIEPKCISPTFLVNQPAIMAPLSKQATVVINGVEREVSRRFELMINSREYVNAYEEENSPVMQAQKLIAENNVASIEMHPDVDYVKDMEWGLPPTAGWGIGVDRLVMLLTNSSRIEQVLAFRPLA